MKLYALLALCCCLTLSAFSQKTTFNKNITYLYFDKDQHQVLTKDAAAFVRVFKKIEAINDIYEVRDYTISGVLLMLAHSSSRDDLVYEGACTWYNQHKRPIKTGQYTQNAASGKWTDFYNNGQKKKEYTYETGQQAWLLPEMLIHKIDNSWDSTGKVEVIAGNGFFYERDDTTGRIIAQGAIKNGWSHGTWVGLNKNGKKYYEEEYNEGKLLKGTRWAHDGQIIAYENVLIAPEYPGGKEALGKFLSKTIKYPEAGLRSKSSGIVTLQFIIDTLGNITNIGVHTGVEKSLNEEAIRVAKLMPAWAPAIYHGKAVPCPFQLPIKFTIIQ